MTDDHDLRRLLDHTTHSGAKLVLVGDPRQLSAVGPGGGLEALVRRFDGHVWRLADNVRQVDLTEREALAELRHGDIKHAINGSPTIAASSPVSTVPKQSERSSTAGSPISTPTSTRSWSPGDVPMSSPSIALAATSTPSAAGSPAPNSSPPAVPATGRAIVSSPSPRTAGSPSRQRRHRPHVHPDLVGLTIRFDQDGTSLLPDAYTSSDRLAHGYAITVHRSGCDR